MEKIRLCWATELAHLLYIENSFRFAPLPKPCAFQNKPADAGTDSDLDHHQIAVESTTDEPDPLMIHSTSSLHACCFILTYNPFDITKKG